MIRRLTGGRCGWLAAMVVVLTLVGSTARAERPEGVLKAEFVYEKAPFPSCHASTIAETRSVLVASWFGGTAERNPDVTIWIARHDGKGWSAPREVADGIQEDGHREPCWNPVLFQQKDGPLLLFYKVGPTPQTWWGMLITSTDGGASWSKPRRLPDGILGPIKNKPVAMPDGALLCPSSSEDHGWRVFIERTPDDGLTWTTTGPLNDGKEFSAIQPSILKHPGKTLQVLCRSRQGRIVESWSEDLGATWSPLKATVLPNPNSGTDAVTLADGRHVLIYNHNAAPKGRTPLNVAVSDDGKTWKAGPVLEDEPGEYSYPAVIQTSDGLVHTTYTWHRKRIKHVVLDPSKWVLRELPSAASADPVSLPR